MTTTLKLYKSTNLLESKNFVIEDLSDYLTSKTLRTITSFQFQRPLLDLIIKINEDQLGIYMDKSDFQLCDYLSFTPDYEVGTAKTYYYFIKKKTWKASSTIELELRMDVLNTFKWNDDYLPTKKTIVEREHKNRYKLRTIPKLKLIYEQDLTLGIDSIFVRKEGRFYFGTFIFEANSPDLSKYNLDYLEASLGNTSSSLFPYIEGTLREDLEADVEEVNFSIIGTNRIRITAVVSCSDEEGVVTGFRLNSALLEIYYDLSYIRTIDFYPEGINPILYKKDEKELREEINSSWNLAYTSGETDSNPVVCELIPDEVLKLKIPSQALILNRSNLPDGTTLIYIDNTNRFPPAKPRDFLPLECGNESSFPIRLDGTTFLQIGTRQIGSGGFDNISTMFDLVRIYKHDEDLELYYEAWEFPDSASGRGYCRSSSRFAPTNIEIMGLNEVITGYNVNEFDINNIPTLTPTSYQAGSLIEATLKSLAQYNRTNSKLYKIIKIPYSPSDYVYSGDGSFSYNGVWEFDTTTNTLKLVDLNSKFVNLVTTDVENPFESVLLEQPYNSELRDDRNESKLFHSDFFHFKFVYDSFTFIFQLEKIDEDEWAISYNDFFQFNFIMTTTINSKFMFQFPEYILKLSNEDFDNILPVARNNEVVIYNNEYLNYLRTAYRYDLKSKDRTISSAKLGLGLGIAGSLVSTGLGIASGNAGVRISSLMGATNSITSGIVSTINTIHKAEEDFQAKQDLLKDQSFSVSGSDDIDLMEFYSNNRARLLTYEISPLMKKAIADLFYYCGYATNEQKIPAINTRTRFNFIKCSLQLEKEVYNEDITNELIARFSEGVTFIHHFSNTWDINQIYENKEVNL